jgi:alpha-mannosidase
LSEIQFGHVRRPTHKSRRFDADRYEVCQQRWTALAESRRGAAILNDCKYGVSVSGGCIALTLLKAAFVPDMSADRGSHEFSYALYAWNGSFAESGLVRSGYEFNYPPTSSEVADTGQAEASFVRLSDPAIVLEALKAAEDGSGDLILRLYESLGSAARCAIDVDLPVARAAETDMLERNGKDIAMGGGRIALDFRAFEIKTLRLAIAR